MMDGVPVPSPGFVVPDRRLPSLSALSTLNECAEFLDILMM